MNVVRFVKDHERRVRSEPAGPRLIEYHRQQTAFVEKEREIHLAVTLAFALFTLLAAGFAVATQLLAAWVLTGLLLVLLVPYIWHYFLLENAVQAWHLLLLEMQEKVAQAAPGEGSPPVDSEKSSL